jgi:menaquinol-cytochrome c reductase iron-sulfur subunit
MALEGPEHTGHGEEEALRPGAAVSMSLITRRRLLGYLGGLLSAAIAVALGLPLIRFYVGNAFRVRGQRWLALGPTSDVHPGEPRLFTVSHVDQDGWHETTMRAEIYAVTENGRDYLTLSNICTHLGCPVRWDDTRRAFICPCHGGVFAMDGRVLHGPPPRPLTQVPHKLEGGVIYVQVS